MPEIDNNVLAERIEGVTNLINERFTSITQLTNEKFVKNEETHNAILVQTTKTNGKVASLVKWRWLITGGGIVILFLLSAVLIPLSLTWAKERVLSNSLTANQVQELIDKKLDNYEVVE